MAARIQSLHGEIKALSLRFTIDYNVDDPRKTLEDICDLVLNQYSRADFEDLGYKTASRIVAIGEAIQNGTLYVSETQTLPRDVGLQDVLVNLVREGFVDNKQIIAELDRRGIEYNVASTKVMAHRVRTHILRVKNTRPLSVIVKEIMDDGKGYVENQDVAKELARRDIEGVEKIPEYTNNYLQTLVYKERGRLGLTRVAKRARRDQQIVNKLEAHNEEKNNATNS